MSKIKDLLLQREEECLPDEVPVSNEDEKELDDWEQFKQDELAYDAEHDGEEDA